MASLIQSVRTPVAVLLLAVWLASVPLVIYRGDPAPQSGLDLGETIYRLQRLAQTVQREDAFRHQFSRAIKAISLTAGLETRIQPPDAVDGKAPVFSVYLQSANTGFEPLPVLPCFQSGPAPFQSLSSPPLLPPPRRGMV